MSMTLTIPVRPTHTSNCSVLISQVFSSPLPNPQLWHSQTVGFLQSYECFVHGGWWHDPSILSATGEGIEIEEPRGWKDYWNDEIVRRRNSRSNQACQQQLNLVHLSMQQKDALTVLLFGRGETHFAEL